MDSVEYEDFRVLVAGGPAGPEVRVLDSPEGEGAQEPFECAISERDLAALERIVQWRSRAVAASRQRDLGPVDAPDGDSLLKEVGERLYRCLFTGEVRVRLLQSLTRSPNLRIRLQLDLGTATPSGGTGGEDRVGLHRLPWELLRQPGEGHRPFALRRGTPVVRYLDVEGRPALPEPPQTLGVLAVASEPAGVAPLDLDRELDELRKAFAGRRGIALRVLESPTLEELIEALRGGDVHVLHFLGHGELDPGTGEGALLLEDRAGRARSLPAGALVEQLGDFLPRMRLIFLNACRTAEAAAGAPWAGVATALVRAGVPAVIAMQLPVTDRAAATFAGSVYRRLARGEPVDRAVAEGRLALRREIRGTPEWATPALFLRVPDGRVFARPARPEPGPVEEGRARRSAGAGRRPGVATWVAAGLVALLLGALVVLRGGAPVERPGALPEGGVGQDEGTAEDTSGAPPLDSSEADAAREAGAADREREPEAQEEPAGSAGSAQSKEAAGEREAPGTPGADGSSLVELAFEESLYVRELRAHVTVDTVTVRGTELVRVTVSPEGHDSQVRSGFSGSTLRFPVGEEVLTVHVLSLDRAAGLVLLRGRRSDP